MAYSNHTATKAALDVVTAALSSGALKLGGAGISATTAESQAISDAKYLSKLISDLAASLVPLGD